MEEMHLFRGVCDLIIRRVCFGLIIYQGHGDQFRNQKGEKRQEGLEEKRVHFHSVIIRQLQTFQQKYILSVLFMIPTDTPGRISQ